MHPAPCGENRGSKGQLQLKSRLGERQPRPEGHWRAGRAEMQVGDSWGAGPLHLGYAEPPSHQCSEHCSPSLDGWPAGCLPFPLGSSGGLRHPTEPRDTELVGGPSCPAQAASSDLLTSCPDARTAWWGIRLCPPPPCQLEGGPGLGGGEASLPPCSQPQGDPTMASEGTCRCVTAPGLSPALASVYGWEGFSATYGTRLLVPMSQPAWWSQHSTLHKNLDLK